MADNLDSILCQVYQDLKKEKEVHDATKLTLNKKDAALIELQKKVDVFEAKERAKNARKEQAANMGIGVMQMNKMNKDEVRAKKELKVAAAPQALATARAKRGL